MRELVSEDDDTRTAVDDAFMDILAASGGDIDRLSYACQFLKKLEIDSDLPQVVEDRLNIIQRVRENRCLGDQVENLVKQSLEDEGFIVRRTGIGSDFEIEHDSAEADDVATLELVRAERKWLVEVKSTRTRSVRMTTTQARAAEAQRDGFLLCVVPIKYEVLIVDDVPHPEFTSIRDSMKFVSDIGLRVAPLCSQLNEFQELREDITACEAQVVQLEVESGATRVRVTESVWQDGGIPLAALAGSLA